MSSTEQKPYASLNEQLRDLRARESINRFRLDDSISFTEDDEEQRSDGESGQESSLTNAGGTRRRTRSQVKTTRYERENEQNEEQEKRSRERRSERGRHVPECAFDSIPTDYGVRYRQEAIPRTPPCNQTTPLRFYSTPQRATYADDSQNYIRIGAFICILALFAIALLFYVSRGSTTDDAIRIPKQSMADMFVKHINHLKEKSFPNQRPRLWSTIRSSIRGVFNRFDTSDGLIKVDKSEGERSPAVVLLVADADDDQSRATAACLAKRLAEVTAHAFAYGKNYRLGFLKIEGSDFIGQNAGSTNAKKLLETNLNGHLANSNTSPVIVLRNVHLLSSEAALILHAYCDNENAPFKEAVYFLTIDCGDDQETNSTAEEPPSPHPTSIAKADEKDWDALAESCLRTRWLETGTLSVDKIAPILSRIANNVVLVRPEPSVDC